MTLTRRLKIIRTVADPLPVAPDRLLKVAEVAQRLGLGQSTVYHLCQRGMLPAVRIPGTSIVRVSEKRLEAFIAGGGA